MGAFAHFSLQLMVFCAFLSQPFSIPLIYNSYIISKAERNYDTYKRELLVIVIFGIKFSYILNIREISIIYIDYKPFIGFLNTDYYEDIYIY